MVMQVNNNKYMNFKPFGKSTKAIVSLEDAVARDFSLVGGKAVNLAKLISAGISVPEGFCVTTTVYHDLINDQKIIGLINELETIKLTETDQLNNLAAKIREQIQAKGLSTEVKQAIKNLLDTEELYALRSSATAEDLPTLSFAGQHDTVLNVSGIEAVTEAVLKCLASLFTDRAVAYRATNKIAHRKVSMAVVVQRMIKADASGVLFTADPTTGKRTVASIDAAFGLGEAIVSGKVTADNVRVDRKSGEILEYRAESRDSRVLSDQQVKALISHGEEIERLFGTPQDIEWSIAGEHFWILQARPITTLFPIPAPSPEDNALHVYYSWNHRQGMTDVMPPLVIDYWLGIFDMMQSFGIAFKRLGVTAGGIIYLDVTPFVRSNWLAPRLFEGLQDFDKQSVSLLEAVRERRCNELARISLLRGISPIQSLSAIAKLTFFAIWTVGIILRGLVSKTYRQVPQRSRQWADKIAQRMIQDIRLESTEHERLRTALKKNNEFVWGAMKQALMLWNIYFYRFALKKLCPESDKEFEALERGLPESVTTTMMLELGDLTNLAYDLPAVMRAISDGQDLETIRKIEGSEKFVVEFENFLSRYGFRASAEIEFSQPRYHEDPSWLLNSIRVSLKTGIRGEHRKRIEGLQAGAEVAITHLEELAGSARFGSIRRRLVRPFALRYRSYLSVREVTKYALSQLLAETRRQVLLAGELLKREGSLENAEDVWFYDFDELILALKKPTERLDIDIVNRRAEYRWHKQLRSPAVITSDGEIPRGDTTADPGVDGLVGIATSGGVAEGIARVIHDPREATLEPGEILIAPHTDPGWTPLFLNAAGLVTNVGGVMTHGSLVAREYGIPSVVVVEATEKIKSGQQIRVDGYRGVVELLKVK